MNPEIRHADKVRDLLTKTRSCMTALALRLAALRIQRHRRRALAKLAPAASRRLAIRTDYWPKPIPDRRFDWSAIDDGTYDGAPDSGNRHQIGYGRTRGEAIADLLAILEDDA